MSKVKSFTLAMLLAATSVGGIATANASTGPMTCDSHGTCHSTTLPDDWWNSTGSVGTSSIFNFNFIDLSGLFSGANLDWIHLK